MKDLERFNRARFKASFKCPKCEEMNAANGTSTTARYLCDEHTFIGADALAHLLREKAGDDA